MEELSEAESGSGYKSAAGNAFNKFGGAAKLESLLEDATGALYQIEDMATRALSAADEDTYTEEEYRMYQMMAANIRKIREFLSIENLINNPTPMCNNEFHDFFLSDITQLYQV